MDGKLFQSLNKIIRMLPVKKQIRKEGKTQVKQLLVTGTL